MKNVLVIAAEGFEFTGILSHAGRLGKPGWPVRFSRVAELNGMRLLMAAHGPGPRLAGFAADQVKSRERVDAAVSTGMCGGLDPQLMVGEIFVASHVNDFFALPPVTRAKYRSGRLVSADRVVVTVTEKDRLRTAGASAVEMEAAALATRALDWNVPFYCVRALSDAAGEGFALDLNEVRDEEGRFNTPRIVGRALRSPFRLVPELLRLKRNSELAAKALGDFFADCSF